MYVFIKSVTELVGRPASSSHNILNRFYLSNLTAIASHRTDYYKIVPVCLWFQSNFDKVISRAPDTARVTAVCAVSEVLWYTPC